jgi:hypothetical protein
MRRNIFVLLSLLALLLLSAVGTPALGANVYYRPFGSTGGTGPTDNRNYAPGDTVTVLHNTGGLVKTGYSFGGWNTAEDGTGTTYAGGDTFIDVGTDIWLNPRWIVSGQVCSGGIVAIPDNDTWVSATPTDCTGSNLGFVRKVTLTLNITHPRMNDIHLILVLDSGHFSRSAWVLGGVRGTGTITFTLSDDYVDPLAGSG